jgi:predicted cupin superfamily sugar epimerase
MRNMYNSEYFVKKLNLAPHPEGGYFREIYKSNHWINADQISNRYQGERSLASTIYFLLEAGQVSKFHRLKADEIMFYHYGSALALHMIDEEGAYSVAILEFLLTGVFFH